jgi:hypothetical protein
MGKPDPDPQQVSLRMRKKICFSEIFFCDQMVQSVVQRPEVQELVQESGLVHTCTSLITDQRLWYLVGIRHPTLCQITEK